MTYSHALFVMKNQIKKTGKKYVVVDDGFDPSDFSSDYDVILKSEAIRLKKTLKNKKYET